MDNKESNTAQMMIKIDQLAPSNEHVTSMNNAQEEVAKSVDRTLVKETKRGRRKQRKSRSVPETRQPSQSKEPSTRNEWKRPIDYLLLSLQDVEYREEMKIIVDQAGDEIKRLKRSLKKKKSALKNAEQTIEGLIELNRELKTSPKSTDRKEASADFLNARKEEETKQIMTISTEEASLVAELKEINDRLEAHQAKLKESAEVIAKLDDTASDLEIIERLQRKLKERQDQMENMKETHEKSMNEIRKELNDKTTELKKLTELASENNRKSSTSNELGIGLKMSSIVSLQKELRVFSSLSNVKLTARLQKQLKAQNERMDNMKRVHGEEMDALREELTSKTTELEKQKESEAKALDVIKQTIDQKEVEITTFQRRLVGQQERITSLEQELVTSKREHDRMIAELSKSLQKEKESELELANIEMTEMLAHKDRVIIKLEKKVRRMKLKGDANQKASASMSDDESNHSNRNGVKSLNDKEKRDASVDHVSEQDSNPTKRKRRWTSLIHKIKTSRLCETRENSEGPEETEDSSEDSESLCTADFAG